MGEGITIPCCFTILRHEANDALTGGLPHWVKHYRIGPPPRTDSPLHSLIYSFDAHLRGVVYVPSTMLSAGNAMTEGTCPCSQSFRPGRSWAGCLWVCIKCSIFSCGTFGRLYFSRDLFISPEFLILGNRLITESYYRLCSDVCFCSWCFHLCFL